LESLLFLCPFFFLWLEKPVLHWIRVGWMDTFALFLILEECFYFFCIHYDVGHRFVIYKFTMLRNINSIPSFIRAFIIKECWILWRDFYAFIEIKMWFLSLILLMCCIMFIDLCMLHHHCIPEMKPTWPWCNDLFNVLLDSANKYFIEDFCIHFIMDIDLELFLLCVALPGFVLG
jgi:hypothetical protein